MPRNVKGRPDATSGRPDDLNPLPKEVAVGDIVPFSFEGAEVRVLTIDGEPWWVAADVTKVLGYRMASDATRWLDDDEKGTHSVRTPGGVQNVGVVNEPGLYALILRSKSSEAKPFKRWVTRDVLPTIRKTGRYEVVPAHPFGALAIESAAVTRAQLEAYGVAKQFGLVNESYIESCVRQLLARMTGEEPALDPADVTITCDEYLAGQGLTGKQVRSARTVLGKAVAGLYRERYGRDPQKIERLVDGIHIKVGVYTRRDVDLFDTAWAGISTRYATSA